MAALAEALTLAEPQGYVRVFADEGAPMGALLGRLVAAQRGRPVSPGDHYLGRLARRARADRDRHGAAPGGRRRGRRAGPGRAAERPRAGGAAPAGRGQAEPAHRRRAGLALDTVKKHVGHILDKLGAANRTEAVARARELGLLP